MTEALEAATAALRAQSESPRTDARRLLAHVLDRDTPWLIAHDREKLSPVHCTQFTEAVNLRRQGVPFAHISGTAGFFGHTYCITANVLVPRRETEHLVERALHFLKQRNLQDRQIVQVLDVGTGSGAICCAIALATPRALVHATDVSAAAIAVAERNAEKLGVSNRCEFFIGDLIEPVRSERYSCVIANLPYIPTAQLPRRPQSAAFDPRCALDGGEDGLQQYRRLLPMLPSMLEPDALVLCEAAPPVIEALAALSHDCFPAAKVTIGRDYANLERFVAIATGSAAQSAE